MHISYTKYLIYIIYLPCTKNIFMYHSSDNNYFKKKCSLMNFYIIFDNIRKEIYLKIKDLISLLFICYYYYSKMPKSLSNRKSYSCVYLLLSIIRIKHMFISFTNKYSIYNVQYSEHKNIRKGF